MSQFDDILRNIKPYVIGWITEKQVETSLGSHELSGKLHTGTLIDSQAPQFLKTDGSRALTGNLAVGDGILLDTVDLSVFKNLYDTHVGLNATTAHGSVGSHTHQSAVQGGQIDHGLGLSGLSDDDHIQYLNNSRHDIPDRHSLGTVVPHDAHGLLSGLGDDDHAQYLRADGGRAASGHLIPNLSDTYDLGSSTQLWRKGWLSELDTVLFAQNTVALLGGWLLVSKDEGVLNAAVVGSQTTTIDFGKTMTVSDFVIFRAAGQVEYVQVGSLVSGTTYNVTRDLDGSGANDWAKGTPFVVLGQTGDGRIELNAYDTPRIQLLKQGATYNAQTEIIRIGDLNGNWGYSSQKWGIAIGEYASNKPNILIDEDGNLKFRLYSADVMSFANGNADITGKLRMPGTSSAIAIGSTPPTASNSGTGLWLDRTGLYSLSAGAYQVKIDATNGKLYAAAGDVTLDQYGINLKILDGPGNQIRWLESTSGSKYMAFSGFFSGAKYSNPTLSIKADRYYNTTWGWYGGRIQLTTTNPAGLDYGITLFDDNIYLMGKSFLNSDSYPLTTFVPLSTPAASTAWDGDSYSTTAKTKIDLSAVFGLPAGIKAVYVRVYVRDSASASNSELYFLLSPNNTAGTAAFAVRPSGRPNDFWEDEVGIVPCDANGDIYYQVSASGTGTMDVNIQIWGYWM